MLIFQICADPGVAPGGSKGASSHLRNVARSLRDRGHRVVTIAARAPLEFNPHPAPVFHLIDGFDPVVFEVGRPDLVYERYSLGHVEGLQLARQIGVPFVLEVNAPLVDEAIRHRPSTVRSHDRLFERRLFSEADVVMAVSAPMAAYVEALRGHNRGLIVVPNGVNEADFGPAASHADGKTVAFLGDPKPWHGADRLPPLAAALRPAHPTIRIKLIGGGPGTVTVLAQAERLGVRDLFEVTGPIGAPEVGRHLGDSAVGIAPYPPADFFYFSPLKIVEYMMAGLPVVASDLGDIGSTLAGGGLLVRPDDFDGIVQIVSSLLQDPARRRALGAIGRSRVATKFTWAGVAAVIEQQAAMLAGSRG